MNKQVTDYEKAYKYAIENLEDGYWSIAEQYYNGVNETLLIIYDNVNQEYETEIIDFTSKGVK
jgi:hypothetical protein